MARQPAELSDTLLKKAVAVIKKMKVDTKDSAKFDALQDALRVARPMAAKYLYAAEAVINPKLKFKLTFKNITDARKRGLRWERIAAYTGTTVPQVQAAFLDGGGDLETSYTGKGKRPAGAPAENGTQSKAKKSGVKTVASKKDTAGTKARTAAAKGKKAVVRKRSQLAANRP